MPPTTFMGTRNNHWFDFLILHGMFVFPPQPLDVKVEACGCTSQYCSPARELQRFRRCAGSRVLRQLLAGSQIDFFRAIIISCENFAQKTEEKSHWNGEGHSNAPTLSKGLTLYDLILKRHKTKIQSFGTAVGPPVEDLSMMIMKPRWFMVCSNDLFYFHPDPWVFSWGPYFTCNPPPRNLPWLHGGPRGLAVCWPPVWPNNSCWHWSMWPDVTLFIRMSSLRISCFTISDSWT